MEQFQEGFLEKAPGGVFGGIPKEFHEGIPQEIHEIDRVPGGISGAVRDEIYGRVSRLTSGGMLFDLFRKIPKVHCEVLVVGFLDEILSENFEGISEVS